MIDDERELKGGAAGMVKGLKSKGRIRGYRDLEVYINSYSNMLTIYREILPKLPRNEYDLIDQLRRSSKAIPRLIAEGHSKRHQVRGFQKYIDDAMAESNETIVSLSQAKDLCGNFVNLEICEKLIKDYDRLSRQLYCLAVAWDNFSKQRRPKTYTIRPFQQPNHSTNSPERSD